MNTVKRISLILCAMLFAVSSFGQTKEIDIVVKGVEEIKGQIIVLVFDKAENFPKDQKLAKVFKYPVTNKEMVVCVKSLPTQDVAIFVYHDKDNNGKCNQNRIGIPTEKIGFSNNVRPKLKAPKFEEAKVETHKTKITIELYKM